MQGMQKQLEMQQRRRKRKKNDITQKSEQKEKG